MIFLMPYQMYSDNDANETIDSLTNTAVDLVLDWCPAGEMAVEQ